MALSPGRSWSIAERPRVGLALGGGAARGMAHVGVLRAFVREGIPVHVIAGTSMGAIVGGAYAATGEIGALEERIRGVLTSEAFRRNRLSFLRETKQTRGGLLYSVRNLVRRGVFFGVSNLRPSFLSAEEFAESMESIVPRVPIENLPIPFGAVCLDLDAAAEIVLCSGDLRTAAEASSAIPGILPPVRLNGRSLIDGGWVDKIPVLPTYRLGADVVIAVDITADLRDMPEYRRGVDIMVRANAIKDDALVDFSRRMADLVIEPPVGHVHWADFGAFEACIEAGDAAVTAAMPAIRSLLRRERLFSAIRPTAGKRLALAHLDHEDSRLRFE